jgi:hypothetical protein
MPACRLLGIIMKGGVRGRHIGRICSCLYTAICGIPVCTDSPTHVHGTGRMTSTPGHVLDDRIHHLGVCTSQMVFAFLPGWAESRKIHKAVTDIKLTWKGENKYGNSCPHVELSSRFHVWEQSKYLYTYIKSVIEDKKKRNCMWNLIL